MILFNCRINRAKWAGLSAQKDSKIELEVSEGKTYYLELTGISQLVGGGYGYYVVAVGSGLNEVKPEYAKTILSKCCKFQKAASSQH